TDPGFITVQWTDPGAAGLDATTFGTADVTITGVTVTGIQDLGNGLVRYNYSGSLAPNSTVTVSLVAGQVGDLAGNPNAAASVTFTLFANPPSLAVVLDPNSDSGAKGDDITNLASVVLDVTTDPGQVVQLGQGGPTATADQSGHASFTVALNAGANA